MIAAARRRIRAVRGGLAKRARGAAAGAIAASRAVDRAVDRQLRRAWPPLAAVGRIASARGRRAGRWAGRRLRPLGALLFRALAAMEQRLLRAVARTVRAATRASAVLDAERAICLTIVASAACLVAAQFVDYRAVEVGQPGYAGLPGAAAPTVGAEAAGEAHAYLLIPVALLAAALAIAVLRKSRRRNLGWLVFGLGLASLAVVLLVDLPAGLDAGAEAARFSGATAVLHDGFYAQIAAAAGLMLGGALLVLAPKATARYHARPCRTRINLLGRAASALRRRRPRRASSRARAARRASPRHSGAESAPASPR